MVLSYNLAPSGKPARDDLVSRNIIGYQPEVGVGMIITDHPFHRPGRAGLPHPALAPGNDAHSSQRIGMAYADGGAGSVRSAVSFVPRGLVLSGCDGKASGTRGGRAGSGTRAGPGHSWAPRSQVVKATVCRTVIPGSNPGAASTLDVRGGTRKAITCSTGPLFFEYNFQPRRGSPRSARRTTSSSPPGVSLHGPDHALCPVF
jgi:hypothetical protein